MNSKRKKSSHLDLGEQHLPMQTECRIYKTMEFVNHVSILKWNENIFQIKDWDDYRNMIHKNLFCHKSADEFILIGMDNLKIIKIITQVSDE